MGIPTLATIVLSWSPPQQSNGIILNYTVTYRVNGSTPVTRITGDPDTTFTIPSLFPQTTISNILVRAYTSGGPVTLKDVVTLTRHNTVYRYKSKVLGNKQANEPLTDESNSKC